MTSRKIQQAADRESVEDKLANLDPAMPEIGDRLWYWHKDLHKGNTHPWLFLVSHVHSGFSVSGVSVDSNGWMTARQRVMMHYRGTLPEDCSYCTWPKRKPQL